MVSATPAERTAIIGAPIALSALALLKLWSGLEPHSLYLDDQWVALAISELDLASRLHLHLPMPPAFGLALGLSAAVGHGSTLSLQMPAIVSYLLTVPAFAALMWRLTRDRRASLLAITLLVSSSVSAQYAVRVKHYTFDLLVAIGALWLLCELFRCDAPGRALRLAAGLATCTLLSFASIYLVAAGLLIWLADSRQGRLGCLPARVRTAVLAGFAAMVCLYYLAYLRHCSRPIMAAYWDDHFLHFDNVHRVAFFFAERASDFVRGALPDGLGLLGWLVPVGLWRLLQGTEGTERSLGVALLTFYALVLLAAGLQVYPVGAGRTDMFGYPVTILAVSLGAIQVLKLLRTPRLQAIVYSTLMGFLLLLKLAAPGAAYPGVNDRQAVAWVTNQLREDDGLILSPYAAFAFGVYGGVELMLTPVDYYGHGFDVAFQRPHTFRSALGIWRQVTKHNVPSHVANLNRFVATRPKRLFYLETQGDPRVRQLVLQQIIAGGYAPGSRAGLSGESEAFLFERRPGSATARK